MDTTNSTNCTFRRMVASLLSIFVILAIALPATASVAAEEPSPFFRAFPDGNAVDGGNWPLGATVHMAIDDPATQTDPDYQQDAEVIASPWDWISTYVRFDFDGAYDLKRGDEVTLTAGELLRYQVVPDLWVTTLDVENNIIGGTFEGADAGTTVHVFIGGDAELYVSTDSDEAWVADFDEVGFDLLAGMQGAVEVWFDEFNDSTIFNWNVPSLTAFPENDAVEGWEWPEAATVTLTIDNASGLQWGGVAEVLSEADPRTFVRIEFGDQYNLQVGDVVTLTDGRTVLQHTVKTLSVTEVNSDKDKIYGKADGGETIYVWPHGYDQIATVQTTARQNGKWLADFARLFDLEPGMAGRSQVLDDTGNATAVDWYAHPRYTGHWRAVDSSDGSNMQLTISGGASGQYQLTLTDDYLSLCDGGPGIVRGTGTPDAGGFLRVNWVISCQGTVVRQLQVDYVMDLATGTLWDGAESWYLVSGK